MLAIPQRGKLRSEGWGNNMAPRPLFTSRESYEMSKQSSVVAAGVHSSYAAGTQAVAAALFVVRVR